MDMHSCYAGKSQPSTMMVNRSLHVENFECDTTGCLPPSVVQGHSTGHQQSPFSPNPQDIVECLYEEKEDIHRTHITHHGHNTDHRMTPMIRPPMSPCASGPLKRYYCNGSVMSRAQKIREFTKEVVCLPYDNRDVIVIPRNEPRNRMAERGLIGNIRFFSNQSEEEIRFIITSVFRKTFDIPEGSLLKYTYLRTMPGTRRLMRAEILPDCKMDGNDIMSFCRQGSLYLLLDHSYEISLGPTENEDSTMDESVFENSYGHMGLSNSSRSCSNDLEVLDKLLQPKETVHIKEEQREPSSCNGDELLTKCLRNKITSTKCQLVMVRRGQIFEDTLWWLRRENWDVKKQLVVKFVGETNSNPEVTKRIYMQTLVRHLASCRAFVGEPGHLLPSDDMTSLSEDLHYHAGRIVGVILTHGDIPINQFAETLVDYIAGTGVLLLQDVPNPVIRKKLLEICDSYNPSCVEDEVFKRIRNEMGFSKVLTPENKSDFVNMAIQFYTTVKNHAQITRFISGLEELGIVAVTKQYPGPMKRLLCGSYGPTLEPGKVYDQFDCHFSAQPGDHCRDLEEVTAIQFFMFLTDCSQKRGLCSLEDFLQYLTGRRTFPPGGFTRKVILTFSGETKCPILLQDPLKLTLPIGLTDQQFSDVMRLSVFEKQEIKVTR